MLAVCGLVVAIAARIGIATIGRFFIILANFVPKTTGRAASISLATTAALVQRLVVQRGCCLTRIRIAAPRGPSLLLLFVVGSGVATTTTGSRGRRRPGLFRRDGGGDSCRWQ